MQNEILLNNQWIKEEVTKEIRKYLGMKKIQHTKTYGTAKSVQWEKFIAIIAYIKNQERCQIFHKVYKCIL